MGAKFNLGKGDYKASNLKTTHNLDNSKTISFNISTSNKSGKCHPTRCPHCNTLNLIPLEQILKKAEYDAWVKKEKQRLGIFSEIDDQKSICNFICGNEKCKMPIADVYTDKGIRDMLIMTPKEHAIEVGKIADKARKKLNIQEGRQTIDPAKFTRDKLEAIKRAKKDEFNLGEKPAGFDEKLSQGQNKNG